MESPHITARKVLYIVTKASPMGGAQHYVLDMAKGALAAGYDVTVAFGGTGPLEAHVQKAGIPTVQIAGLVRDVGAGDVRAFFSICSLIRILKPHVLHLNSSKAGAMGAVAGRLLGVRNIIFTDHGWAFKEKRPAYERAAIWLISWVTVLLSSRVITVSDFELDATRQMPFATKKAVRIYNGIDLSMHFGSGDIIRTAFPKEARITGTVGELTKNKNQIALIEQARKDSDMYVAIVGEGELRRVLENKIREYNLENRVKLFGYLPASEVMKGFDIFALPSLKESLGYALVEARAAGLPIMASRVGGIPEAMDRPLSEFSKEKMVAETLALYR
jgi:glycosyltransferase involved in cell wall biosynthesis